LAALNQHLERVQVVYDRIVHAQRPLTYSRLPGGREAPKLERIDQPRHRQQNEQRIAAVEALRGRLKKELGALLDKPEALDYCERLAELSPFLWERLLRRPELLKEVHSAAARPDARPVFERSAARLNDIDGLRRFYSNEMFRILVSSVCKPDSVFHTLDQLSGVTEFVISRAYRIALEQALAYGRAHAEPGKPFSPPEDEMMVIALGRLGMREFDTGSDADLLFILPDSEVERQRFWTRVAERMIHILTVYGDDDGAALTVDTRLRPNGREGMLVQLESAYVDYFASKAEAWEGIAYMKARALAGDLERATRFLGQLQQVDWRRYGQGGRSRQDLRQMRLRLQREQSAAAPLKAGEGGYYDADFILMYLRLKGAGLFYKSLNTPERIDVVEKMGHLEQADAQFLLSATTFLRAIDHGSRVVLGRAEEKLPADPANRERVGTLVQRWTEQQNSPVDLEGELAAIQGNLRRLFDTVFHP
jgi:glutamate-ammonia-ligase adenylyltransferase